MSLCQLGRTIGKKLILIMSERGRIDSILMVCFPLYLHSKAVCICILDGFLEMNFLVTFCLAFTKVSLVIPFLTSLNDLHQSWNMIY